jgi:hypothetical protein
MAYLIRLSLIMRGLDPRIHADARIVTERDHGRYARVNTAWIAGS